MPRRTVLRIYLAVLLVLGLIWLESATVHPRAGVSRVSGVVNTVLLPLEVGTHSVVHWAASGLKGIGGALGAEAENARLKADVAQLRSQVESLQAAQSQNTRLRQLLGLRQRLLVHDRTIAAPVVGRSPVNWLDQVVIAAGSGQGVKYGDAVLAFGGLVGRVIAVGPQSATVMLLPDPESAVGAMVARSGDAGVLLGNGQSGRLVMQFFAAGANVRKGDLIVTSGLDSQLPAGLPLGHVQGTRQGGFGLVREATVQPTANLNELETVLVVLR